MARPDATRAQPATNARTLAASGAVLQPGSAVKSAGS
jgi:hypothetical protein